MLPRNKRGEPYALSPGRGSRESRAPTTALLSRSRHAIKRAAGRVTVGKLLVHGRGSLCRVRAGRHAVGVCLCHASRRDEPGTHFREAVLGRVLSCGTVGVLSGGGGERGGDDAAVRLAG